MHLTTYVLADTLFVAINFIYSLKNSWFIYPLVGWGLFMHYLFGVHWLEKGLNKREVKVKYRVREKKLVKGRK